MDRDKKSQNMQRTVSGALDILGSAHADSTVTVNGQGTTRQDAYYGTRKNGNLYEQYIWSARYLDAPVLRDRDADGQSYNGLEERLYYTGDAHFNVTALVNISGAVVERYEYDPYGKAIILSPDFTGVRPASLYANELLFSGYRYDPETGLYHARHRMYHSTLGCWLSRDPIKDEDGPNTYLFLKNDSVNRLDALGLLAFEKNECQGCNAGIGISRWYFSSYWHEPEEKCRGDARGTYVVGSNGGFAHHCGENHSWQTGPLCDTETHIFIRAINKPCCRCKTWLVRCQWEYVGSATGPASAEMTIRPSFLGRQVAHLLDKDPSFSRPPHPPPYSSSVGPRGSIEYGVLDIPCGATRDVFRMQSIVRINGGAISEIREAGWVSCSAECLE